MRVAGFGFRKAATGASLSSAYDLAAAEGPATALAAPEDKCPALAGLAAALNLPLIPVAADALRAAETETRSPAALAARGTGSVAEAAALAAAGPGARLVAPRRISADRMATCAIAESETQ